MKRLHIIFIVLGFMAGLAFSVSPARAENRPAELPMFQMLNGEVRRDLNTSACTGLADGGGLTLWTADAGIACNCVKTGIPYKLVCQQASYFCPWGDGGCSATVGSPNFGDPVATNTPYYFIPEGDPTRGATKLVCMIQTAAAVGTCVPFRMQ